MVIFVQILSQTYEYMQIYANLQFVLRMKKVLRGVESYLSASPHLNLHTCRWWYLSKFCRKYMCKYMQIYANTQFVSRMKKVLRGIESDFCASPLLHLHILLQIYVWTNLKYVLKILISWEGCSWIVIWNMRFLGVVQFRWSENFFVEKCYKSLWVLKCSFLIPKTSVFHSFYFNYFLD